MKPPVGTSAPLSAYQEARLLRRLQEDGLARWRQPGRLTETPRPARESVIGVYVVDGGGSAAQCVAAPATAADGSVDWRVYCLMPGANGTGNPPPKAAEPEQAHPECDVYGQRRHAALTDALTWGVRHAARFHQRKPDAPPAPGRTG